MCAQRRHIDLRTDLFLRRLHMSAVTFSHVGVHLSQAMRKGPIWHGRTAKIMISQHKLSRAFASYHGIMESLDIVCLFVCVEVLWPSQPSGVMSSAVSLPNHTFTGQALSSKRLTSIVHILSPETDNCPSWISGRERMTVENISWSISKKECCRPRRG